MSDSPPPKDAREMLQSQGPEGIKEALANHANFETYQPAMNDGTPEPTEKPRQAPQAPDFAVALLTAPALASMDLPQRPRLLGEFLREADLAYLFAPRGHGKSWLAMLIGHAVAKGLALGQWAAGESPRPVYYFDAEMNLPDVQARARKIGITSERFHWLSNEHLYMRQGVSVNIADPAHQAALSVMLPPGSLFIIDNLCTGQKGMRENEHDDFDKLKDWLLELRRRKITTIIVHHAGRAGDNMRGGSRREDPAHWILSLKDASEEGTGCMRFTTTFTKCRNCQGREAPPLRWTIKDEGEGIVYTCENYSGRDALLSHISDGVTSATELAELLGVATGTVSKWAAKLMREGFIKKNGRDYKATGAQAPNGQGQDGSPGD